SHDSAELDQPTHQLALHTIDGHVFAEMFVTPHPTPSWHIVTGGLVGRRDRDRPSDGHHGDVPSELDDRQRTAHLPAIQLQVDLNFTHNPTSARRPATTSGSTCKKRSTLSS